jgi:hypothetical protein
MNESNNENTILNKIHKTNSDLLVLLNKIKDAKREIQADIEKLDNNYFVEKTDVFEQFNDIIDDQGIYQLTILINLLSSDIKHELDTKCSDHEFIDDSADIGLDQTVYFCYCKRCHMSKKP